MDPFEMPASFVELLGALPDAVLVATSEGRIVAANANLCALSGHAESELVDSLIEELVPGRLRAQHVALRSGYIASGGGSRSMSSRLDIVLLRADGSEVPVDVGLCTIPYADDRVVIATLRDASSRRNAELSVERERAFLTAMNDVSRSLLDNGNVDETLDLVTRRARVLLDADLAMLVLPDTNVEGELVIQVADGLAAHQLLGSMIPADSSMAGIAMREHEPALIADGSKDPRLFRPPAWPHDIGATLVVPLHARGKSVGSLTIARRGGRPMFLASDVSLMKTFAAHATLAIADVRRQENLRLLRALDERDRMADTLKDTVVNRLYSVGLTLHVLLQHDLPEGSDARIWSAIDELDETIAAMRDAIFPRDRDRLVIP
jgi:PAS domain S-box-containing protein